MKASEIAVQIGAEIDRQKAVAHATAYGDGPLHRQQLLATLEGAYQTASLREYLERKDAPGTLRK